MIRKCHDCKYYRTINYSNGACGIGCLAHNMTNLYPVDITRLKRCPLDKDEKK